MQPFNQIATERKPLDLSRIPTVGINIHNQHVTLALMNSSGTMSHLTLEQAVERNLITMQPSGGSYKEVTHFIGLKLSRLVLFVENKDTAEPEPTMTDAEYRELRRRKLEAEVDPYGLQTKQH